MPPCNCGSARVKCDALQLLQRLAPEQNQLHASRRLRMAAPIIQLPGCEPTSNSVSASPPAAALRGRRPAPELRCCSAAAQIGALLRNRRTRWAATRRCTPRPSCVTGVGRLQGPDHGTGRMWTTSSAGNFAVVQLQHRRRALGGRLAGVFLEERGHHLGEQQHPGPWRNLTRPPGPPNSRCRPCIHGVRAPPAPPGGGRYLLPDDPAWPRGCTRRAACARPITLLWPDRAGRGPYCMTRRAAAPPWPGAHALRSVHRSWWPGTRPPTSCLHCARTGNSGCCSRFTVSEGDRGRQQHGTQWRESSHQAVMPSTYGPAGRPVSLSHCALATCTRDCTRTMSSMDRCSSILRRAACCMTNRS